MKRGLLLALSVIAALQSSVALPHHSFAMWTKEFATATGTVKEYQWENPHVWIIVMVPGPDGKSVQWGFETASPGGLKRRGWKNTSIKPGDKITVTYHTSRNGDLAGNIVKVVLPDQSVLTAEDLISHPPG
jgi:Family of unknown function (DUF6152)